MSILKLLNVLFHLGFASSPAFGDFQTSDKKELHPSGEIRFPHEEDEYDEETDTTGCN